MKTVVNSFDVRSVILDARTQRPVDRPRLIMLNQTVKDLLRCNALVSVDRDGRVANGERVEDVGFFARNASGQLYGLLIVRDWNI